MLIKFALASLVAAGFAGCVPCSNDVTEHGLAARPQYDGAIDECITTGRCIPLCRGAFGFDASIEIAMCKIERVDAANAHLLVRFYDPNACTIESSEDDDFYWSDDGGDDGGYSSDDGSTTDDGSTDDGSSDDGTDDGDYGGDDGGDSGDDGGDWGERHAPRGLPAHTFVNSVTATKQRQ
ncbi:MAG: hypothetical protein ABI678_16050 [Kofleriaceae bacterium]